MIIIQVVAIFSIILVFQDRVEYRIMCSQHRMLMLPGLLESARSCILVVRFLVLPVCNNSSYSNNTMTHTRVKSSNAKLVLLPLAAAELESLMIMVQQPLQCFGVLIDRILSWVAHPELGSKKEKTKREIILLLGK